MFEASSTFGGAIYAQHDLRPLINLFIPLLFRNPQLHAVQALVIVRSKVGTISQSLVMVYVNCNV